MIFVCWYENHPSNGASFTPFLDFTNSLRYSEIIGKGEKEGISNIVLSFFGHVAKLRGPVLPPVPHSEPYIENPHLLTHIAQGGYFPAAPWIY